MSGEKEGRKEERGAQQVVARSEGGNLAQVLDLGFRFFDAHIIS